VGLGLVAGSGLLAGCTSSGTSAPPTDRRPSGTPTVSRPDPLLAVLAVEEALLEAYDTTLRHFPALRAVLASLRADHAAHAAALRTELVGTPSPLPSRPGSSADPASPEVQVSAPATRTAARAALADRERAAATGTGAACLVAPAARSVLLGSIAACETSHLIVLR